MVHLPCVLPSILENIAFLVFTREEVAVGLTATLGLGTAIGLDSGA